MQWACFYDDTTEKEKGVIHEKSKMTGENY